MAYNPNNIYNSLVNVNPYFHENSRYKDEISHVAHSYLEELYGRLGNSDHPSSALRPAIYEYFKKIIYHEYELRDRLEHAKQQIPNKQQQILYMKVDLLLRALGVTLDQFNGIDFSNPDLQKVLKDHITFALLKK